MHNYMVYLYAFVILCHFQKKLITVLDRRGVSGGRYVDVGCLHFNGTSMALQRHFYGTSTAKKNVLLLSSASVKRFSVSRMRDYSSYSSFVIQKSV